MKSNARINARYDKACSFLTFLSICFMISVIASMFFRSVASGVLGFAVILILFFLGYCLMSLWAKIIKLKRQEDSHQYESNVKYFSFGRAFPPISVALLLCILVFNAVKEYEYQRIINTPGEYYDPDSVTLFAFIISLAFLAIVVVGIVLWFIPYQRISSQRTVMGLGAVMIVVFTFGAYTGAATISMGLSFIGYILCTAAVFNQNSLKKTYRGTVMEFLTPNARRYNLLLTLALFAMFVMLIGAGYLVGVGLLTLGRLLLYFIVNASRAGNGEGEEELYDPAAGVAHFNSYVFNAKKASDSVNYWIFIVFTVLFISSLIIFLFRRQSEIRRLLKAVRDAFIRFLDAVFSPISGSAVYFLDNMRDDVVNYVDVEERLVSSAKINDWSSKENKKITYRDFNVLLRSVKGTEDQLKFAYSFFVEQMRAVPQFVKKSDTPRQIKRRVISKHFCNSDEISEITDAYERAVYSDGISNFEAEKTLKMLCNVIKRHLS